MMTPKKINELFSGIGGIDKKKFFELQSSSLKELDNTLNTLLKPTGSQATFGLEFEMLLRNKSDGNLSYSTIENNQPTTQIMNLWNKEYSQYGEYTYEAMGFQAEWITKTISHSLVALFDISSELLNKASEVASKLGYYITAENAILPPDYNDYQFDSIPFTKAYSHYMEPLMQALYYKDRSFPRKSATTSTHMHIGLQENNPSLCANQKTLLINKELIEIYSHEMFYNEEKWYTTFGMTKDRYIPWSKIVEERFHKDFPEFHEYKENNGEIKKVHLRVDQPFEYSQAKDLFHKVLNKISHISDEHDLIEYLCKIHKLNHKKLLEGTIQGLGRSHFPPAIKNPSPHILTNELRSANSPGNSSDELEKIIKIYASLYIIAFERMLTKKKNGKKHTI